MHIDVKNPLIKTTISESKLGSKKMEAGIGQNVVSGMEQKSLSGEDSRENKEKVLKFKPIKKEQSADKLNHKEEKIRSQSCAEKKVERDPIKLLKLF